MVDIIGAEGDGGKGWWVAVPQKRPHQTRIVQREEAD